MNNRSLFIFPFHLVLICMLHSSCTSQQEFAVTSDYQTQRSDFDVLQHKGSNYDLSILKTALEGKRIVALGESSHGLREYYKLKSEIVKYLHEEMGFEVLAMEGGLGDINWAWSNIDQLDAQSLRDKTVFGNFRCREINSLFDYMIDQQKAQTPLIYAGFDTQKSSNYLQNELFKLLLTFSKPLADSFKQDFNSYYLMYQASNEQNEQEFNDNKKIFINQMDAILNVIQHYKPDIKEQFKYTDFQIEVLKRSLESYKNSVNIAYRNRYNNEGLYRGIVLRDELMFDHFVWLAEEMYPDKKFIIWAHNGHVQKSSVSGSKTKWMGNLIKEKYKDDYYSLGLFTYQGNGYEHWSKKTVPFKNDDSAFLESKMQHEIELIRFLNLQNDNRPKSLNWVIEEVNAFEMENGGVVTFIPKKRFDGVITIYQSEIPTYK